MTEREIVRRETADSRDLDTILGIRSMFRKPRYLNTSAWTEHIPFAFWIVEALQPRVFVELGSHYGVSYFAFCQAVEQLGLGTRCHAIDTWKGDGHAGFYGNEVYETVRAHNAENYSGFSQLLRSAFDDSLAYFADGSIDLLHIDGLHTLDAVRHDFETWLPKMSDRGVILLHDTNVRERGFGVHLLMDELRTRFPVFEFVHCHGLGVVLVGNNKPKPLRALMRTVQDPTLMQRVTSVFSRLGEGCLLARDAGVMKKRVTVAESQATEHKAKLEDLGRQMTETTSAQQEADKQNERHLAEIARLKTSLDEAREQARKESDALSETRSALLQKRAEADEVEAALSALREEVAAAHEASEALRRTSSEQEAEVLRLTLALGERDTNIDERFQEIAILSRRIIDIESRPPVVSESEIALREETQNLRRDLAEALRRAAVKPEPDMREIKRLQKVVLDERGRITTLERALQATRGALDKANKSRNAMLGSTSWKITAPLRAAVRSVRGR